MNNFEAAKGYRDELGYSVIPVNGKIPAIKWAEFQERRPTDEELGWWFKNTRYGIAAVCGRLSNLTVLDADEQKAEDFVAQNAVTEEIVRTPSGHHHYHFEFKDYPNKVNLFGIGLDVRSEGGLAVLPPSPGYTQVSSGVRGKIGDILPAIEPQPQTIYQEIEGVVVDRTINYLKKLDPAISGQGGQKKLYRACCVVADRLSAVIRPEEALQILQEWNAKCVPPWSEAELLHSLESAWRR